jgi:hypothetical protein
LADRQPQVIGRQDQRAVVDEGEVHRFQQGMYGMTINHRTDLGREMLHWPACQACCLGAVGDFHQTIGGAFDRIDPEGDRIGCTVWSLDGGHAVDAKRYEARCHMRVERRQDLDG